jgi:hypothetical protein
LQYPVLTLRKDGIDQPVTQFLHRLTSAVRKSRPGKASFPSSFLERCITRNTIEARITSQMVSELMRGAKRMPDDRSSDRILHKHHTSKKKAPLFLSSAYIIVLSGGPFMQSSLQTRKAQGKWRGRRRRRGERGLKGRGRKRNSITQAMQTVG